MKAVVVYESMYGNTHLVADAIASGIRASGSNEAVVVPVGEATPEVVGSADLVVVGGPTHAHGMSHEATRHAAVEAAEKPDSGLEMDPDAEGPGLRDWFGALEHVTVAAAAFDTRMDGPGALTGHASKGIARRLRHHGCTLVVEPMSFLVTKDNHLVDEEAEHARGWGAQLVAAFATPG